MTGDCQGRGYRDCSASFLSGATGIVRGLSPPWRGESGGEDVTDGVVKRCWAGQDVLRGEPRRDWRADAVCLMSSQVAVSTPIGTVNARAPRPRRITFFSLLDRACVVVAMGILRVQDKTWCCMVDGCGDQNATTG